MPHSNHISPRMWKEHSCLLVQRLGRVWVGGAPLPTVPYPSPLTMSFCSCKFESCAWQTALLLLLLLSAFPRASSASRALGLSFRGPLPALASGSG